MSATEQVVEQLPEAVLEDAVEVVTIVKNNPVVLAGVALLSLAAGGFVGYKYAQSRLKMHYENLANEEIQEAKEYYSHLRKEGSAADPEVLLQDLHGKSAVDAIRAHRRYAGKGGTDTEAPAETEEELSAEEIALHVKNGVDPRPPIEEVVEERKNVFENRSPVDDEDFDYEAELARRNGDRPYIITHDEFYENETDYEQMHITYFAGDDVLVDERDQVIPDEDAAVGDDNLTRFGHGSKDAHIVYVRNEKLETDFEITRSFGKYAEEVLGFDVDDGKGLKHSAGHGGVRKFRTHHQED